MHDRLKIVYEDQWLIVADKPAGLLSMSTGKREGETTAYSILTGHYGKIFIVHRLDRDTSGLIVFAKDQDTKLSLQENWNEAVLERGYTAVLEGKIEDEEGWIETWLYEHPKSLKVNCYPIEERDLEAAREGKCRYADRNGWKYASSHCRRTGYAESGENAYTFVEFELETGRKNQIRVQSQWIGHPIAGDRKYGAETNPIGRLALHAGKLSFIHPWTGKIMKFSSPLPNSFKKFDKHRQ
ncbi:MAG: RluA family pseudouridine synthase [Bacteroidales bacterium]|nr:RluA family pseudouridine synthase [Bacteroidales bacterium]